MNLRRKQEDPLLIKSRILFCLYKSACGSALDRTKLRKYMSDASMT